MSEAGDDLLPSRRFRSVSDENVLAPGLVIRLKYALYLFISLMITMLIKSFMSSLFEHVSFLEKGCAMTDNGVVQAACGAEMLIYRVSFSLLAFFLLHWITVSDLTCCIRSKDRAELQDGFFMVRTFFLVLIFVVTLFIPNGFFTIYAYVCLICSALYLLVNVVFLVDFSYQWSDDWGERSEHNSKWLWYLLAIAVGSLVLAIGAIVASFIIYVPNSDCNYNACAITSVIVGAFIYFVLSIYVPHGSIVPSSIVFLYTSCILFFTLRSSRSEHCNRLANEPTSTTYALVQGLLTMVLTGFTLLYSVVVAGGNGTALNIGQSNDGDEEDADETGHLSHYMFFYGIMMLGSMYLAMLGSNWHVSGGGDRTLAKSVNFALWVRMSTVWTAILLYIWSLVAPYVCCKGRDFGFAVDDDWE